MILVISIAVGILFTAGTYLILKRDLIRVVAGMVLISNAANLFIMGAAVTRGGAPILPIPSNDEVSDPVVQAMTLTAVVISFGVAALLLAIVYRVYIAHRNVDLSHLSERDIELLSQESMADFIEDDKERG